MQLQLEFANFFIEKLLFRYYIQLLMCIDKSIKLDKTKLPPMLQEDFSALEQFYDNDDWFNFGITIENRVPSIKAFDANGTIDADTSKLIRRKFGIV